MFARLFHRRRLTFLLFIRSALALFGFCEWLFADLPDLYVETETELEAVQETGDTGEEEQAADTQEDPEIAQWKAYLEVVQVVKEQAITTWIDDAYRRSFYSQLPIAIINAKAAGLMASEITAAMQIGDFLGNRRKQKKTDVSASPATALIT